MNNFIEENDSPYRNKIGYPFSLSRECNSNPEIINLKCPACGQVLRETEYYDACEEIRTVANEIAKHTVQEHLIELESEYLSEIKRGKRT